MQAQSLGPMTQSVDELTRADLNVSGVSWGAVLAGAAAAAALSLILLILGFGLGLSAVSPWSYSATAIGASTIVWLAFTQLAASGIGGYLAGRLRVKWAALHGDEVFFRDTAHGLLAWAVASLFTAAVLAGAVRVLLGGAVEVGVGAMETQPAPALFSHGASNTQPGNQLTDYYSDMLLRAEAGTPDASAGALRTEVGRILLSAQGTGKLAPDDRDYLSKQIAQRTGLAPAEAQQRADTVYARYVQARSDAEATLKQAADRARKTAAHSALWMFVALLTGAFVASLSATFGGRLRDKHH
ncbi:hypothetical protein [Chitinimonas naiadis]